MRLSYQPWRTRKTTRMEPTGRCVPVRDSTLVWQAANSSPPSSPSYSNSRETKPSLAIWGRRSSSSASRDPKRFSQPWSRWTRSSSLEWTWWGTMLLSGMTSWLWQSVMSESLRIEARGFLWEGAPKRSSREKGSHVKGAVVKNWNENWS